jgi:rRNA maturation protein Rpf1
MRFTTSRKPSPPTRRIAKTLANYLGADYITRGKSGLDGDVIWMVVVEDHGNPSGLSRRHGGEEDILGFSVSFEGDAKRRRTERPVVVGDGVVAREIAEFFGLEYAPLSATAREIRADGREIEFFDGGDLVLRLNISGRIYRAE